MWFNLWVYVSTKFLSPQMAKLYLVTLLYSCITVVSMVELGLCTTSTFLKF